MRLREICGRATQHLDLLLKELVPAAELSEFIILRASAARFLTNLSAFLTEPFIERADVDAEVIRVARA